MFNQSIPEPVPVLMQTVSTSTKDTSSNSGRSYQPEPVYSFRRLSLRSLPCEPKPDIIPYISPNSGRYVHGVRILIRPPQSRRLMPADHCIFWMFAITPTHSSSKCVAGPTVCGRIPARSVSPFEDGYELTDRHCGYKARGVFAPVTLDIALPGQYTVTAWIGHSGATLSRTYHVTPLFP